MAFDAGAVRLERFKIDVAYHAAFDFWTFKGVLAEKYAHGPKFGAYVEVGNQVKLTPKSGFTHDRAEVAYGIKSASFDQEQVRDKERTYEEARLWFRDVFQVLGPRRITAVSGHWFALHPVGASANIDAAESQSKKIRLHYYNKENLDKILPEDYDHRFSAINGICLDGDKKWSTVIGAVGPPHRNQFFGVPDQERDEKWWMGLRFDLTHKNDDGLDEAGEGSTVVEKVIDEGAKEYERLVDQGLRSVV